MKKKELLLIVSVLICMLIIAASCARKDAARDTNSIEENPYAKLSKSDMKYRNIQMLDFTISPQGVEETNNPQNVLAEAQSVSAQALTDSKLFETVRIVAKPEEAKSTLIVQGELTQLKIVGTAARFWIGGIAGKSHMTVRIKLLDAATGAIVIEKNISEDSNPHAGAYTMGATDRVLPLQVGNLIADFVISAAKR